MGTPRIGLVIPPTLPPEDLRAVVLSAVDHVDEVWFSEDCFNAGGLTQVAAALGWTEGSPLVVGAGLLPVPLHPVAAAAMDLATLARAFPGRFRPGVGSGVQPWMGQAGVKAASPLALLREYLPALRRLLDGEEVTTRGQYVRLGGVRLAHPPTDRLPLLVGAAGPRTMAVARELADGTLLSLGATRTAAADIARETQRTTPGHEVLAPLVTSFAPDGRQRIDATLGAYGMEPDPDLGYAGDADGLVQVARSLGEVGVSGLTLQRVDGEDLTEFVRVLGEVRSALG